jgi:hypothetical protein
MDGIEPGVVYEVLQPEGNYLYGVTPDGEGVHWYDTEEEAVADRLDLPVNYEVITLTDDEFEEMRSE